MQKSFFKFICWEKKLKADAIPTVHMDEMEEESEDFNAEFRYSPKNLDFENVEAPICTNCEKQILLVDQYRKKYSNLLKKYKKIQEILKSKRPTRYVRKLNRKNTDKSLRESIDALQNISTESKTFCKLLLTSRPKEYSEDVKYLAQNIFYKSQSTYFFLRDKLNLSLPHVSTLNRWAPIKFLQPGLKNNAFESVRQKCSQLDDRDTKHMVLIMDEMSIRKELRYNTSLDLVDGFETTVFERTNRIGTHVCVFMIKSMVSNFAIILNYFISHNGLSADTLSELVKENINILKSMGINIRVLLCDQGSTNRKCFSNLKVSVEKL